MLIKYTKSVLWRVAERLSYIEDAWCLKVNVRNREKFNNGVSGCKDGGRELIRFLSNRREITVRINFDVSLTVHLSIFILVINQLDAQNLFYNKRI